MAFEIQQLGEITREYREPISRKLLNKRINAMSVDVASQASLKGFRKGKAPKSVIQQRYGTQLETDVVNEIAQERCEQIVKQHGEQITWIGRPIVKRAEADGDDAFSFSVRVETIPNINLPNLEEIIVKKPTVEITNQDIEKAIANSRKQCIDWYRLKAAGIPVAVGDRLTLKLGRLENEDTESSNTELGDEDIGIEHGTEVKVSLFPAESDRQQEIQDKLFGLCLRDVIALGEDELLDVVDDPSDLISSKPGCTIRSKIVRIETGDLPVIDKSLLSSSAFQRSIGIDFTPSLANFQQEIKTSLEEQVETAATNLCKRRALIRYVEACDPLLPRETIRDGFLKNISQMFRVDSSDFLGAFYFMFDALADGRALPFADQAKSDGDDEGIESNQITESETPESSAEEKSNAHDGNEDLTSAQESEDYALESDDETELRDGAEASLYRTIAEMEYRNSVQKFANSFVIRQFAKERDLEADKEWVNNRLNEIVSEQRAMQQLSPELEDQLYSEQHLYQLSTENLVDQTQEILIKEMTIEAERMSLDDFIELTSDPDADTGSETEFVVEPSIPIPELENQMNDTISEEGQAESAEATESDGVTSDIEESDQEVERPESQEKKGFFKRLFNRTDSAEE